MATNKAKQKTLDKKKWLVSEELGEDMSGKMGWCNYCNCRTDFETCVASQQEREVECLCAKAYNRLQRKKSGN